MKSAPPPMTPDELAALDGQLLQSGTAIVLATDERKVHGRLAKDWQITHLERDGQLRQLIACRRRPDLDGDWSWHTHRGDRHYMEVTLEDLSSVVVFCEGDSWYVDDQSPRGEAADARLKKIYGPKTLEPKRSLRRNPHG